MPKKIIKKYMPSPESIKENKNLQFLGDKLHDPNLRIRQPNRKGPPISLNPAVTLSIENSKSSAGEGWFSVRYKSSP
jgi:hypothetical protein